MEDTPVIRYGGKRVFFAFYCLFSFKKAVNEEKTKFVFSFFD